MNRTDRTRAGAARTDRTRPAGRHDRVGPARPGGVTSAYARRQRLPRYWFAERLLAVLSGRRPVHWMLGHTVGEAYEQLVLLAPASPLGAVSQPVVRHCDEYVPQAGVIEAFARIGAGDRVRAMAFRLEQGADLRWRCAAVEVGPGTHAVPGPTR
ncbi:Rv3235 family protein [Streptomyces sp. CBMA152]|uniref:Rv3235 family protein n=1 Tax=Streptomyces sp. CBMA152 TaxID=1896312 RepID=UPI00166143FC|nr:Rv3235 family protein [Streptomyces sp. CBMA152]